MTVPQASNAIQEEVPFASQPTTSSSQPNAKPAAASNAAPITNLNQVPRIVIGNSPESTPEPDNLTESRERLGSSSATDQSISTMYKKINNLTKCLGAGFAPENTLSEIFRNSRQELENLLTKSLHGHRDADAPAPDIPKLVDFICDKAPKIFATLVKSEREHLISRFFETNVDDSLLPVTKSGPGGSTLVSFRAEAAEEVADLAVRRANEEASRIKAINSDTLRLKQSAEAKAKFFEERLSDAKEAKESANAKVAATFRGWRDQDIDKFCDDYQWRFAAPVFQADSFNYIFAESTVMPFSPSHRTKTGTFSWVEKRQVHPDHLPPVPVSLSPIDPVREGYILYSLVKDVLTSAWLCRAR